MNNEQTTAGLEALRGTAPAVRTGGAPPPTDEQVEIIEAARRPESTKVDAYAGTGKTTTLTMAATGIKTPALALAFNKSIAEEFKKRFPPNFMPKTMNGLGFGALQRALPAISKWNIDARKLGKLLSAVAKDRGVDLSADQWAGALDLVRAAMLAGITPGDIGQPLMEDEPSNWWMIASDQFMSEGDFDLLRDIAHETLERNVAETRAGRISFDDQIYHSTLIEGRFPLFPTIFVDEAQDLSPLNHLMVGKCLRSDSKLLICGDPKQAIYGFRGADHQSMNSMKRLRPSWLERPLRTTFRCPKLIVERQQEHAPGYRAASGNIDGRVVALGPKLVPGKVEFKGWTLQDILALRPHGGASIAVLCRNNGPLFSLAFKFLRAGIGCTIRGREIGKSLISLTRKLVSEDSENVAVLLTRLREWEETERSKAEANDQPQKVAGITDRVECIQAVADNPEVRTAGDLRSMLTKLFAREFGEVELSSIHKCKGLEYDVVVHLDPWRIPSRYAREAAKLGDDSQLLQEWNLKYVAETRAKHTLAEASLKELEVDDGDRD